MVLDRKTVERLVATHIADQQAMHHRQMSPEERAAIRKLHEQQAERVARKHPK